MAKISKELAPVLEDLKKEIRAKFKAFKDSLERDMGNQLKEIRSSLSFIDKKYDDFLAEIKKVYEENKQLKDENIDLRKRCDILAAQAMAHEGRLIECEQYSRNANIEVKGIPVEAGGKLTEIMSKIGNTIGEDITAADIEVCHRVAVPGNPSAKNIIVQFVHRQKRNAVLNKARKNRFSCEVLGFAAKAPVYVNEHLCPERKRLLAQAINKKRDADWKFVWVRGGQIYARKSESSRALKISNRADVAKIT
ncbi:hypothetical protein HPB49_007327 [Dermacentor silvarum]|uniref:Uncharacterized protein n=1 Tax=Dermacentor silvarum TaxID=543639 RepID=A0ACB8D3S9_DERSI|nr:hypothetical protein HPB49_007327 [Dermacentor silvarum]